MKALITAGYGAGFSEWNDRNIAVDQRVIAEFEKNPQMTDKEFEAICESFGYEDVMILPYDMEVMEVVEIPDNVYFKITSYDGWEEVEIFNPDDWFRS